MPYSFTEAPVRRIKSIAGNSSTKIKITPTAGKRLFAVQLDMTYAGGTNTLAGLMTVLTEIRVKVGTAVKWRLSGTVLRDWCLLHGASFFDFNGLPNTGAQVTIPLVPEWFNTLVQDALAWNPSLLGGNITIEIDSSVALTITNAYEVTNDDLTAPSAGIIALEVITPVAGGTSFFVEKELDPTGRLLMACFYPDSTNTNTITPCSLYVGADDTFAHEDLSGAENTERLERFGLTPTASGRTAGMYDMVFVKDDGLGRAINLDAWGVAKFKVGAASAMAGTVSILLARLVQK